jgi:hypothetical protein
MKRPQKFLTYLSIVTCATTGCASAPSTIPAANVPDEVYKTMDCVGLLKERDRLNSTLHAVADDQQSRAGRDAFAATAGAVVSPVFYLLLTGESGVATEVSRLKGEIEAVSRVAAQKSCALDNAK